MKVTKTKDQPRAGRFDIAVGGTVIPRINGALAQRAQSVRPGCIEWTLPGDPEKHDGVRELSRTPSV